MAGEVQEKQTEIERLIPLTENHIPLAIQAADVSELATTQLALEKALVEKEELEEQLRCNSARVGVSTRSQSMVPGSGLSPRISATSPPPPLSSAAGSRASSHQPDSRASSPAGKVAAARSRRGFP